MPGFPLFYNFLLKECDAIPLFFIKGTMKSYFPKAVSYNRFVDIGKPRVLSANYFLSIFVKVKFLDLYILLASFGVT